MADANLNPSEQRPYFDSYDSIGCERNASDEDVVVACYRSTSSSTPNEAAPQSLKAIALARQSHFLFFMISIYGHLNEKIVAILANRSPITCSDMEVVSITEPKSANLASTTTNSSSQTERHQDKQGEPCDTSDATTEAYVSGLESPSSSEADIALSSEGTNADSDFESDEMRVVYLDNTTWRCRRCHYELVDGECPNGHYTLRCTGCQSQLASGLCPICDVDLNICEDCGAVDSYGKCYDCIVQRDDDEEDIIAFDSQDGVWRCIYCQWEVEADSDEEANCHCLRLTGIARNLDLRDCLDYEPADSCSSGSESSDEEPDSEDDNFIDDENIDHEGQSLPKTEPINPAAVSGSDPNIDLVLSSMSNACI